MERFNVPVPPEEDFPQIICAQRNGEDFKTEYVEYVPRWNVDKNIQAVIVDKKMFFDLTGTVDRLQEYNAKLRKLVRRMHDHIKESCDICDEDYCSSWDEDNECCVYDTMLREVLGVVRP